jgi:hypothetical protein
MRLNEKILMSGPPTVDSDSDFNRHSTIMSHMPGAGLSTITSNIPIDNNPRKFAKSKFLQPPLAFAT